MYSSDMVADRIKYTAKQKKCSVGALLSDLRTEQEHPFVHAFRRVPPAD